MRVNAPIPPSCLCKPTSQGHCLKWHHKTYTTVSIKGLLCQGPQIDRSGTEHTVSTLFPYYFQVLAYPWIVWAIPTTALWRSQRLELITQLCSALLHYQTAVTLFLEVQMGGSFPMEVKLWDKWANTTELEHKILEHYFFIATLRVPQQASSAVTYLMPVM